TRQVRVACGATSVVVAIDGLLRQLAGLMELEHAPLTLPQQARGVAAPAPLFTSILSYRHSSAPRPQEPAAGGASLGGIETLYLRERSNYPLIVSVDDTGTGFGFVVQAVRPADP